MAHLSLSFLGPFQVTLDGRPVTEFESVKVRALLAYLAVEAGRSHPRDALAGLLWPDWPQSSALANLRYALSDLRQCIADRQADPPFLVITREEIGWNPSSNYDLDVATFERGIRDEGLASGEQVDVVERLASCEALYRGAFLEGLSLADSPPFEEWLRAQREHLEQRFLALLQRLGEHYERTGDYAQARRCAERQVAIDPLREEAQRRLMRALALGGDRNAALGRYQAYRATLAQELAAEPAPETTALYDQILQGTLLAPPSAPSLRVPESPSLPVESLRPLFVAREQEMAHLERWLEEALRGQGRVGFVAGEPGSGKTMLLREFARRAMETHPDLVAAGGNCNAYAGVGDPYLPFVEALRLLAGDVEAQCAAGTLTREHARRLREIAPAAVQALLQAGPSLIDVLIPGVVLLEQARALPDGAAWEARAQEALSHRLAAPSQAFLFDQAARVLQALARQRPLLLLLDDLQWSDAASLSLLFHIGRRLAGQRILIVGAYRPEEVAQGREGQPHPLQPLLLEFGALWEENEVDLAQAEGRALVEALVDSEPNRLGPAFREELIRHTGGHALFTVELLRGLQQRGDLLRDAEGRWTEGPALDWGRLPKRVEAVIAAHIARLPRDEQELLAAASVEGEEFHAEVAARALGLDERQAFGLLSGALSQEHRLVSAQSLRRVGEQRFSRYRFRHHLFQRYLYGRLDPVRRSHLHGEVVGALEGMGAVASGAPDWTDTISNLSDDFDDLLGMGEEGLVSEAQMAWHCAQAGLAQKAVLYHLRAGRRSSTFSIDLETQYRHWTQALGLLDSLPQSVERAHLEQCVYFNVAAATGHLKGQTHPEAGRAYRKSLEAAERVGDPLLIADSLMGLTVYHRHVGELDVSVSLGEQAVRLSRGGPLRWALYVQGHLALSHLHRGDFADTARLLEPVYSALYSAEVSDVMKIILLWFHFPWPQWCLGYPDRALQMSQDVLALIMAQRRDIDWNQIRQTLAEKVCFTRQLRREAADLEESLRPLLAAIEEHRCVPYLWPYGTLFQGWVQAQRGELEQGIETMRRGLEEWSQQLVVMRPYWKGYLAEALGRAGRVEEGLQVLAEALEQVERTGERFNEAELWRLKGELLLAQETRGHGDSETRREGEEATVAAACCRVPLDEACCRVPLDVVAAYCRVPLDEAEACFRRAIEVARRQEARSWELRATTSLARLLRAQERGAEAREMLAAIYQWFTEGFDTPDLVEAKALLDDMTANAEDSANHD